MKLDMASIDSTIQYTEGTDAESMRAITELANHDLVIDITIMGSDDDYSIQLFLADKDSLFGKGISLQEAVKDVCAKFAQKINKDRN